MAELHLVIGDKNYSSWSLRPWVWLKQHGVAFSETTVVLGQSDTLTAIQQYKCGNTVPILIDGSVRIWDSLAILEYLAEQYPQFRGWPSDVTARAFARAVSAEMHSSFFALRSDMPLNCALLKDDFIPGDATQADISRIEALWNHCLSSYGKDGPWLFGRYSIADAMFAPVVLRFRSYGVMLDGNAGDYMSTVLKQPAIEEWLTLAAKPQIG